MTAPAATSSFRVRIRAGETLIGGFVFATDPNVTEIYAAAGFDFVILDLEHTMSDLPTIAAHLRAARAVGIPAVVRIGRSQLHDVPRLLDGGCRTLMLPHLGLPQYGADEALRALRYPPLGDRPTCTGVPAAGFGLGSFPDYVQRSNDEVGAIGLVEDRICVDTIDHVLDSGLVDCVMPGPGDLSVSYGVPGQFGHPLVQQAIATVLAAAQRRGIPAGLYLTDPAEVAAGRERGFTLFVLSIDYRILGNALRAATTAMRAQLA